MSNFAKVFGKSMKKEGGYANHPLDRGGETYRGIARKFHPNWDGWEVVDRAKEMFGTPKNSNEWKDFSNRLQDINELNEMVREFYKITFWDRLKCDEYDEELASLIFDIGIWSGVKKTGQHLQRGLNVINNNGRFWNDILVDGVIGPITIRTVEECYHKNREGLLEMTIKILQGYYLIEIMENDAGQEVFAWNWISRIMG